MPDRHPPHALDIEAAKSHAPPDPPSPQRPPFEPYSCFRCGTRVRLYNCAEKCPNATNGQQHMEHPQR